MRGGAVRSARWAHNPEVVKNGSNPTPAPNNCSKTASYFVS